MGLPPLRVHALRSVLPGALAALVIILLAPCGSPSTRPLARGGTGGDEPEPSSAFTVAPKLNLVGSPTSDRMKSAGIVRIGAKDDQPGLGYMDRLAGLRYGFAVLVAAWIAAELGFAIDHIEFVVIPSADRDQAIGEGRVDDYVGLYSLTGSRKELVDFGGPYLQTGQGLVAPQAELTSFLTYSECVDALANGEVDVVTTDEAILVADVAQDPDRLKGVGGPFTTEHYGVGLSKDDSLLRLEINGVFADGRATWERVSDQTLGRPGLALTQPAVDDYP